MTAATPARGGHPFAPGDTVDLLAFVGPRRRWREALAGAAGCLVAQLPVVVLVVLVARDVVPAELGSPDAPDNRGGWLHWYLAFAWTTGWGIGLILMLRRVAFLKGGGARARLTRVDGGWHVAECSRRPGEGFALRDGGVLRIGSGRLLGLRPSPRSAELVLHTRMEGSADPSAAMVGLWSIARRDELSVRAASAALAATGSRLEISEVDSLLRTDI
ncbi:hypothetical protein [Demequina soli]|uniref:hypothetical protein n=1 Tax=Demequina soli TaxID=1638987 RepID=UPI0007846D50|nr:hypothetical protein [Demequina soli]